MTQMFRHRERSQHRCAGCALLTRERDRLCYSCRAQYAAARNPSPDVDGLTGGRWVQHGLVMRWEAA